MEKTLDKLVGLVATVVTTGSVKPQYAEYLSNLRSHNDRNGLHNIEYKQFYAVLVEQGRDSVVQHMLAQNYDWVLMIDADAAPFPNNSVEYLLNLAFHEAPQFDVIGAYCQLKGESGQPTIDTGTGTWEEHYPKEGLLPVIRTGGHFLFCKRSAFQRFGPPWFRTRTTDHPVKALATLDNFMRCRGGDNPLKSTDEWQELVEEAKHLGGWQIGGVGEDSGFCDALVNAGGQIAVDTNLIVGHIADEIVLPEKHIEFWKNRRRLARLALGVSQ
jgi:hypothetical protein